MAYVEVDVDMGDLETHELVDELCSRLKSSFGKKALTDKQKKSLAEDLQPIFEMLLPNPFEGIEIKSLDDKMKCEHLANVFNKYTSSQLENLIP